MCLRLWKGSSIGLEQCYKGDFVQGLGDTMIHGKKFLDLCLSIIWKIKMPHPRGMEVRRKLVETHLPEESGKRRKTWKE